MHNFMSKYLKCCILDCSTILNCIISSIKSTNMSGKRYLCRDKWSIVFKTWSIVFKMLHHFSTPTPSGPLHFFKQILRCRSRSQYFPNESIRSRSDKKKTDPEWPQIWTQSIIGKHIITKKCKHINKKVIKYLIIAYSICTYYYLNPNTNVQIKCLNTRHN
jgi:hypothetical protein